MRYAPVTRIFATTVILSVVISSSFMFALLSAQEARAQAPLNQLQCSDVQGGSGLLFEQVAAGAGTVEPGSAVNIPLTITNDSNLHRLGVSIGAAIHINGNPLPYDWLVVDGPFDLNSGQHNDVSLHWLVPGNAPAGSYEARIFSYHGDSDSLMRAAMSQTSVSSGVSVPFTVAGNAQATVLFDTNTLSMDDARVYVGVINEFPADSEQTTLSLDLVNQLAGVTQTGQLTLTTYQGLSADESARWFSVTKEVSLSSIDRQTSGINVPTVVTEENTEGFSAETDEVVRIDSYVVVAEFSPDEGPDINKLTLLFERSGSTGVVSNPVPTINSIGVQHDSDTTLVIACVGSRDQVLALSVASAATYEVAYNLLVHPINQLGEPQYDSVLAESAGTAQLGGGVASFVVATPVSEAEEFAVRLVTAKGDIARPSATHEVVYRCDSGADCQIISSTDSEKNQRSPFVLGIQLATLVMLLTVIAIFFCNTFPLLTLNNRRQTDVDENQNQEGRST